MKQSFIAIAVLLSSSAVFAQKNTVATGGDASGSGGSASYTVGQIDYINVDNGAHNMNAGVQQPYEFYTVGIEELTFNIELFPNPSQDELHLTLEQFTDLNCKIYEANGRIIEERKTLGADNVFQVSTWAKGMYNLVLFNKDKSVQNIKIIKN